MSRCGEKHTALKDKAPKWARRRFDMEKNAGAPKNPQSDHIDAVAAAPRVPNHFGLCLGFPLIDQHVLRPLEMCQVRKLAIYLDPQFSTSASATLN